MALLGMMDVSVAFGGPPVLDHADLQIERGERVALLGRNGAGKSTLMKLLDGTITPDSGEIVRQSGVSVARLEQEIPVGVEGNTFDVVAAGLGEMGRLLARYHQASHRVATDASEGALRELDSLHQKLEAADAWQAHTRVETVIDRLGLDPDLPFASASGGRKRRTLLARAIVREPDVLLLDEPTNHLDVSAIEWLESFLVERGTTLLFVTHDRTFLRHVATRIVELDRGRLASWGSDYDDYLVRRARHDLSASYTAALDSILTLARQGAIVNRSGTLVVRRTDLPRAPAPPGATKKLREAGRQTATAGLEASVDNISRA